MEATLQSQSVASILVYNTLIYNIIFQIQTVAMMMMTFFYSGGITACLTVAGDYAEIKLGMTPDAVTH